MAARRAASIGDCCNLLSMDGRRFRLLLVGAVTPAAITKVIAGQRRRKSHDTAGRRAPHRSGTAATCFRWTDGVQETAAHKAK